MGQALPWPRTCFRQGAGALWLLMAQVPGRAFGPGPAAQLVGAGMLIPEHLQLCQAPPLCRAAGAQDEMHSHRDVPYATL